MSVVTRTTTRRWVLATAGASAVGLAAPAWSRRPTGESGLTPEQLVRRALASSVVAHSGLAQSTGTLGLPDLPRLGEVASLLGGTTRARVWWRSSRTWRVDRITSTGESGTYAVRGQVQTWDFETGRVEQQDDVPGIRLPRVDDLLPPQAARRALAGVRRRDLLTALPARRVAGRAADGVRITPSDPDGTVGRVDLYVDEATGLPLLLVVVPRDTDVPALRTAFVEVSLSRPDAASTTPRVPDATPIRRTRTPDLASAIDRYAPFHLPATLGGRRRSRDLVGGGGTATYGRGFARFAVLPLWRTLGSGALRAATDGGGTELDVAPPGEAVLIGTPLLNAVVARSGTGRRERSYLLAGTVVADVLHSAVEDLLADPPPVR